MKRLFLAFLVCVHVSAAPLPLLLTVCSVDLTVSDSFGGGQLDAQSSISDSRCRGTVRAAAVAQGAAEVAYVVSRLRA